ncbi:MAG: hypothetical protein NZ789_05470 [Pseudomonadales bacterium]|nr:hypothetical protein [Pseudomonadales bacterium]
MAPPARRSVRQVLIFEEQNLEMEYHIKLRRMFGELHTHPSTLGLQGHPEVPVIAN